MENKNQLHNKLWTIANILRGKMDANEYKNYILGLIFFKFLSDKLNNAIKEDSLIEEDLEDEETKDIIITEIGYFLDSKYLWKEIVKIAKEQDSDKISDVLKKAFWNLEKNIENRKSEKDLKGLLIDLDLDDKKLGNTEQERNKLLGQIILELDELHLEENESSHLLGDAYEFLLSNFASSAGKKGGEFYTPKEVSILLAKIIGTNQNKINYLYDPTCGSGSLLIQAFNEAKKAKKIYGQELNHTTFNLARMNMFLHRIDYQKFELEQGDTIENDKFAKLFKEEDKKPMAIVANPPFGTKWSGDNSFLEDERFSKYGVLAPKSTGEMAFIQHMIYHLHAKGIMATVAPHGILFREGAEAKIRKYIIENDNYLDTLISLPDKLFFGTSISAVILIFKKERKDRDNVLFIDASNCFEKSGKQNKLKEENIDNIIDVFLNRKEIEKETETNKLISKKIKIEEIKSNDFNLSVNRYLWKEENVVYREIEEIVGDINKTIKNKKALKQIIDEQLKELLNN